MEVFCEECRFVYILNGLSFCKHLTNILKDPVYRYEWHYKWGPRKKNACNSCELYMPKVHEPRKKWYKLFK